MVWLEQQGSRRVQYRSYRTGTSCYIESAHHQAVACSIHSTVQDAGCMLVNHSAVMAHRLIGSSSARRRLRTSPMQQHACRGHVASKAGLHEK
eukprot:4299-Heterococcus_DN1.PRE.1